MESEGSLLQQSTVQSESLIEVATLEDVLRSSCRIADVRFVGVQSGFGLRPDMLLFQPVYGPCKGTTLSIPIVDASPLKISCYLTIREIEANESFCYRSAA